MLCTELPSAGFGGGVRCSSGSTSVSASTPCSFAHLPSIALGLTHDFTRMVVRYMAGDTSHAVLNWTVMRVLYYSWFRGNCVRDAEKGMANITSKPRFRQLRIHCADTIVRGLIPQNSRTGETCANRFSNHSAGWDCISLARRNSAGTYGRGDSREGGHGHA
jgi:hypothetical protein